MGEAEHNMPDVRDIQIHLHEHITPLRERVGKIEGQMQVHDRELTLLRQGLDGLRDRIDGVKSALLDALESHTRTEEAKFTEISAHHADMSAKLDSIRNWVLAVGLGAAAMFAVFEFLVRAGIFKH